VLDQYLKKGVNAIIEAIKAIFRKIGELFNKVKSLFKKKETVRIEYVEKVVEKEVPVEKTVIKEVPVEKIKEVVKTVVQKERIPFDSEIEVNDRMIDNNNINKIYDRVQDIKKALCEDAYADDDIDNISSTEILTKYAKRIGLEGITRLQFMGFMAGEGRNKNLSNKIKTNLDAEVDALDKCDTTLNNIIKLNIQVQSEITNHINSKTRALNTPPDKRHRYDGTDSEINADLNFLRSISSVWAVVVNVATEILANRMNASHYAINEILRKNKLMASASDNGNGDQTTNNNSQ
jgi:hypothetical protein